jgi:hypothetical protein
VAFTAKWFHFDEFKQGGLHDKHAVATGNHLSIWLHAEENQDGRSQELPNIY